MKQILCEVYTRVVGYYRPIQNWNDGKRAEYMERLEFLESDSLRGGERIENRRNSMKPGLTIYTRVDCSDCDLLKRKLKSSGIPFTEIDIDSGNNQEIFIYTYKISAENGSFVGDPSGDITLPGVVLVQSEQQIVIGGTHGEKFQKIKSYYPETCSGDKCRIIIRDLPKRE